MKGSRKGVAPIELTEWLALESDDWKPSYDFDRPAVKVAVRDSLFIDQRGLCVYCGRKLDRSLPGKTYHIEHFRPRSRYPERQVAYENLFLSCGNEDSGGKPAPTCGNVKGNWFDEDCHVYPDYSACTERFRFRLNGAIEPAEEGDKAAEAMIDKLALNHPELQKDRADILALLDIEELDISDFWRQTENTGESYAHVAFQHLGAILP
ncbi:retron system putative HNH endonuclease [Rhizobium sp. P28RR-XV]|uniref:retron system putative HNH endonuclease n=1 Tax=Rhizobium sp. P28RR-XV TaxID=2726737 RepID=UPI0014563984|nr:retron system putative HNH endonuclease [Rhizobium sp. P28RR-XV]NLR88268.1 TIGR02646 family protein [Rhizobium sp. P28RR-XV]